MKILLLCANQANQIALAHKVHECFGLAGIVLESKTSKKISSVSFLQLFEKVLDRTVFVKIRNSWTKLLMYYLKKYPQPPSVASIKVSNINTPETIRFIQEQQPDLLIVSGTSLIRKEILSLNIPKGILNLHTGLSPYVKGGPNCTNWCIAQKWYSFIGNTIMWIDAGIDTGNLVLTERTPLTGKESYIDLHIKVMEHAHELYLRSIERLQKNLPLPNVSQDTIAAGTTFYSKQWGIQAKLKVLLQLLSGFKNGIRAAAQNKSDIIKTVGW